MSVNAPALQTAQPKAVEVDRSTLQRQIDILKELKASDVLVKKAEEVLRTL